MAWDPDNQFQTQDRMSQIEYGTLTLGSTGTVEATTRLSNVLSASATHKSGAAVSSAVECDCTITSGAVTFTDRAGAVNGSAIITYQLRGRI